MFQRIDILFYKLRYLTYTLMVLSGLFLILLLITFIGYNNRPARASDYPSGIFTIQVLNTTTDGLQTGMAAISDKSGQLLNSTKSALKHSVSAAANTLAYTGNFTSNLYGNVLRNIKHGAVAVVRLPYKGVLMAGRTAGHGLAVFNAVIKPPVRTSAQVITPLGGDIENLPALPAAIPAPLPKPDAAAIWPIHGAITTEFGVPHWPYQPTHTGLDISDGKRSGITPILAYRPGRVVQVLHSSGGLGNNVIVDHGNGLTSVYGHMSSTAVQVGQPVDQTSVLGYEGSTGVSTGTHLHFEVRVNGQPVNPRQYVSGLP